ncbi:hypothetical protein EWM62_10795 [Mucilaginibacter terrigena]|uniref:Uncharacterized protein n=1 Tax=Mucilaginibacter terrigena TaxID=2492395 RepID=A0A4Q5LLR5_9SPHI|nr:LiaF domain-containing protein [Mucilaginibacter terrigena]RYU90023.1 hypothetical protein EWM62_10795 [Mucilaginibacter terrigena]
MSNNIDLQNKTPKGKVMAGLLLLLVGGVMLLQQLNVFFIPDSVSLWPLWLIFWGLVVGAKNNFQKPSGVMLIGLGVIFMLTSNLHNSSGFVWPAALIGIGLWIISKKNSHTNINTGNDYWDKKYQANPFTTEKPLANFDTEEGDTAESTTEPAGNYRPSPEDFLNATAIFGGVNKTILSKNFRGGDITNIFGGTELDFTQADIHGRVIIDITQMFGGTKIIVPSNWHVVPDLAAVFAGVDDKRIKHAQVNTTDKVLVLKGVSVFAGVDIRSY